MSELRDSEKIEPSICVLCGNAPPIKNSHILPKFGYKWMIDTGGTRHLRFAGHINKRVQDGLKYPLMCKACEAKASQAERYFCEEFFLPSTETSAYPKKTNKSVYDFLCILHLRCMSYFQFEGSGELISEVDKGARDHACTILSEYLRGERHSALPLRFFLLPLGLGHLSSLDKSPPNWHRYIRRQTEFDFVGSEEGHFCASYFKIGPWVSFAHLRNAKGLWTAGEVFQKSSKFREGGLLPPEILDYLNDRAWHAWKVWDGLSERQKEVIDQSFANGDLVGSGRQLFEAIAADVDAFGNIALRK